MIGIASPPGEIIDSKFYFATGASNIAGKESTYIMEMTPSDDLEKNVMFRVIFPEVTLLPFYKQLNKDL